MNDEEWKKFRSEYSLALPEGYTYNGPIMGQYRREIKNNTKDSHCNHEYINVGFRFDKFVCKNCNKDKE